MKLKLNALASIVFAGALATSAIAGLAPAFAAGTVSGAGATFPAPIYLRWAAAYPGGTNINYSSIGSGGGIAQIKAKTVTFGASDAPLAPDELDEFGLAQFPTVIGGVVPIVNLRGIGPGEVVLNGEVLAKIFEGKISNWSDPAIAALNPGLSLPSQAIAVVHRSDGSGTTFIFANYLSKVSESWADDVGFGTAVDWPVGIGARGNEGVASNTAQTQGAIGYVEYAYALQNQLSHTRMINSAGNAIEPNIESFRSAAAAASWEEEGFYEIITDEPGADVWPIAGATFILMPKNPSNPEASSEALKFFQWAYESGDDMAESLDYVPLPDELVNKIMESWSEIQGWNS